MPLYPPASGGGQVFFGAEDPGAVGAGAIWMRWDENDSRMFLSVRNEADDGWLAPSFQFPAGEASVTVDPEKVSLVVGEDDLIRLEADDARVSINGNPALRATATYTQLASPTWGVTNLRVNEDGTLALTAHNASVLAVDAGGVVTWSGADILMPDLPSADPEVAGALFTSGAPGPADPKALMVSGGPAA